MGGAWGLVLSLGTMIVLGTGCTTSAVKSDFLSGNAPMHSGKYVENYWSAGDLTRQSLSRIYVEPIDRSRIQDAPNLAAKTTSEYLEFAINFDIRNLGGWTNADQPEAATARLALAITYFTPGSAAGRMWAAEFGAGHAIIQIEGKLTEATTGKSIACFADRRRDSAAIGFEDLGGDAGPRLIKRMVEAIARDFVKELSASAK